LRIVIGEPEANAAIDERNCRGPLGVRRREEQTDWHTQAQQGDAFAADLIEYRHHVINEAFEEPTLTVRDPVRRAGAPRVEPDVTTERRQPVQEVRQPRLVPHQVDRTDRVSVDQHVDRTVADHLIRDLAPTRRPRVLSLG
jgi:hypothetical protein